MICKIGGGSYGQVWMALSVTGAYRAVKIVAREDFRLEKTFEREFEGIKKFEPISRSHEGLVDILHVGRSYEENFYYYVMELADDRHNTPGTIDPYNYEARTLRGDIVANTSVEIATSAHVGAELANALHHLHTKGLSHRDVKPSNIIFVNGSPKLADIGLVAETGQQTFVGTEGFVPPEGPGTPQADIFSLGMVLYELATGKDRLDFPELPDDFTLAQKHRGSWHRLNQIICQCCTPDRRKRYLTALEVQQALLSVSNTRPPIWKRNKVSLIVGGALAAAFTVGGISSLLSDNPQASSQRQSETNKQGGVALSHGTVTAPEEPVINDSRSLTCNASHAIAYTLEGREIGPLTLTMQTLRSQRIEEFIIDATGYQSAQLETRRFTSNTPHIRLKKRPSLHQGWQNPYGMVFRYDPVKNRHIAKWPLGEAVFRQFLATQEDDNTIQFSVVSALTLFPGFDGADTTLILTDPTTAAVFCKWMSDESRDVTEYKPELKPVFAGPAYSTSLKLLYCQIGPIKQG